MPTARGWIFAALSSLILVTGIARDELGAVIWGGGILLLEVVVIVGGLIGRTRLRSKRDAFSAEIEHDVVEAGANVPVRVTIPDLVLLPGFALTHDLRLEWSTRVCTRSVPVRPATTERWDLATDARGDFRSLGSALVLRDVFGFTASRLTESRPKRLLVVPTDPGEDVELPARRGGDHSSERSQARVRSEELREVRPYIPGDDMRLVSWKHLATYQELLVRVGELIPPTRGRVEVRIDAYLPSGASPPEVGDALMRTLRAIVRQASHSGVELRCRFPTRREPLLLNEDVLLGAAHTPDQLEAMAAMAGFLPGAALAPGDPIRPPASNGPPRPDDLAAALGSAGGPRESVGPADAPRSPEVLGRATLLLTARPRGERETGAVLSVNHLIEVERLGQRDERRPGRGIASMFVRELP